MKNRYGVEHIWVDEKVAGEALTQRILKKRGGISFEILSFDRVEERMNSLTLSRGKRILFLTFQKGGFVKPCPATKAPHLCCRYTIINQAAQCPMDCTYCILQDYVEHPLMTLYVDLKSIFEEIDTLLTEQPGRLFRFGTGELSDSLVLDDLTDLSIDYNRYFSGKRNAVIELKTKTVTIQNLLDRSPKNTVVSWSVNPQKIIDSQEFRTSGLEERLKAARLCQDGGYLLGFHFDPIVYFPDWENEYRQVVNQIFTVIDGSRIVWISLGSLRFPPSLKGVIQRRFPQSRIIYEEMIRGLDGKMRYPRPLRTEMFKKIYEWIKEKDPSLFIYFCMESPAVWDHVTGSHPSSNAELDFRFARSMHERFPELEMEEPDIRIYK